MKTILCKAILIEIIIFSFIQAKIFSQNYHDFGFTKDNSVIVKDINNDTLLFPWAGGMNSCHFSSIDLDFDGIKDLFVFDRHGNRILTFINSGTSNNTDYIYAPQYSRKFPKIKAWANLVDFNNDGKEDIFAFNSNGGIEVYKNISDTILEFDLIYTHLQSYQSSSSSGIIITDVDYPAFSDIDNDGDLDILTFYGLGSSLDYHKNMSQELYSHSEKLEFVLDNSCWGHFAESESSNIIILDTCWNTKSQNSSYFPASKHTGSTLLAFDMDADNDKDLLIGDVDFKNLIMLTNGGTVDSSYIISQDTVFPSNSMSVDLCSFPVSSYVDVDNDNKKDLIVSSYESGWKYPKADNINNVWLYKNIGTNNSPIFAFDQKSFFQSDMIESGSGARPILYDIDNDSLIDLFIGNFGYLDTSYYEFGILKAEYISRISYYKNTGTKSNPVFQLITDDFANTSVLNLINIHPSFADLDNDGDIDMLCGNSDGKFHYYENNAGASNPPQMILNQLNYQNIDIGKNSCPQLIDINNDGLTDLVSGKKDGRLAYFENTGTSNNPVFSHITDSLGNIRVTDDYLNPYFGYSVPCFFKDNSGDFKLFAGSVTGNIFYYKNINGNLSGNFSLDSSLLLMTQHDTLFSVLHSYYDSIPIIIDEGLLAGVSVADLNDDGYPDMICGNYAGGLSYFKGTQALPLSAGIKPQQNNIDFSFKLYPNPANNFITIEFNSQHKQSEIEVYNILGEKVLSKSVNNSDRLLINTLGLKTGLYICKIKFPESERIISESSKKFIINH